LGYHLHRQLTATGIKNMVVTPQRLDIDGRWQKTGWLLPRVILRGEGVGKDKGAQDGRAQDLFHGDGGPEAGGDAASVACNFSKRVLSAES
jgi:hypothetical protein